MRIGIMSHSGCGGSSVIACELALSLSSRHEVHLITYHPPYFLQGCQLAGHHSVVDTPCHDLGVLKTDWSDEQVHAYEKLVLDVIKEHKLQVIHIHYAVPFLFVAAKIKAKLCSSCPKLVLTFHGTDVSQFGQDPVWQKKIHEACKAIDVITSVSDDYAKLAEELFSLEQAPKTIPNFVRSSERRPNSKQLPKQRKPRLIHVSNFREVKNIPGLIRVYDEISKQMDVDFWLVGEGPCIEETKACIAARSDAHKFRLVGASHEVGKLLEDCELFLLCSRAESFSRSAIEAANKGLPCVGPKLPGLSDTILHEKTGLLFQAENYQMAAQQALSLLRSPELYKNYSQNSLQHASQFDSERISQLYEELFSSMTEVAL